MQDNSDPMDYTQLFNTQLTPEEEQAFAKWQAANPRLGNAYDYDARGFWKAGGATSANGHGSDQYKKPNHPTFSNESIYNGVEGMTGGRWVDTGNGKMAFYASPTNQKMHSQDELVKYFKEVEPDIQLVFPGAGL